MTNTSRVHRWRQVLLWSAAVLLSLGPPAYLAVVWTRQRWAIQELETLNQPVNELSKILDKRLSRHHVLLAEHVSNSHSSIRSRFLFANDLRFTDQLPDLLAPTPTRLLFSPFPPLDVQIYVAEPAKGQYQRNASTIDAVERTVELTSRLNAIHSLHIISPETEALFDRRWHIRELCIENWRRFPETKPNRDDLSLERVDRSMPRLHILTLLGICWTHPVTFPEQGFGSLVSLDLCRITTERFELSHRSGLKYFHIDGDIREIAVRDVPDLERILIGWLQRPGSIAIKHLPQLKSLSVTDTNDITLSDLPDLEAVYLGGDLCAKHLQSLTEMPKLKRVGLSVLKFDAAMVDQLLKIKSMEELHLSLGKVRGNLARLAAHPSLKVVQVYVDGWEHLKKSERDGILESELKTLALNGRIHVDRIKSLHGFEVTVLEDDEKPPQDMSPVPTPGGTPPATPVGTVPAGNSP